MTSGSTAGPRRPIRPSITSERRNCRPLMAATRNAASVGPGCAYRPSGMTTTGAGHLLPYRVVDVAQNGNPRVPVLNDSTAYPEVSDRYPEVTDNRLQPALAAWGRQSDRL